MADETEEKKTTEASGSSEKEDNKEGQQTSGEAKADSGETGDEEPPVRKGASGQSPQEKRLGYKVRQLKKEKEKLQAKLEGGESETKEKNKEVEPTEAGRDKLAEEVENLKTRLSTNEEINDFIEKNPQFKPYKDKIKRYANHPSRRQLPVQSIAYEVAGPEMVKEATEEGEAQQKANRTKSGGTPKKQTKQGKMPDFKNMGKKEFENYISKVKRKG